MPSRQSSSHDPVAGRLLDQVEAAYAAQKAALTEPFKFDHLQHPHYDFSSQSPKVSLTIQNAVEHVMGLAYKQEVPAAMIDQFITFVDHDEVMPLCRMVAPEFRYHPSDGLRAVGADRDYTAEVSRILNGIAHRFPPTPGAECPLSEKEKGYREEHKEKLEQMRQDEEEQERQFRGQFPTPSKPLVSTGNHCRVPTCLRSSRRRPGRQPWHLRCSYLWYTIYTPLRTLQVRLLLWQGLSDERLERAQAYLSTSG